MGICESDNIQQLAILQYIDASTVPVSETPTYGEGLPVGIVNHLFRSVQQFGNTSVFEVSNERKSLYKHRGSTKHHFQFEIVQSTKLFVIA